MYYPQSPKGLGQDDGPQWQEPIVVPKPPKLPGEDEWSPPLDEPAGIPLWLILAGFGALLYATDERPTRRRKPKPRPAPLASIPADRQPFLMLGAADLLRTQSTMREGCRDESGKFIPVPQCTGRMPPGIEIEIVEKPKKPAKAKKEAPPKRISKVKATKLVRSALNESFSRAAYEIANSTGMLLEQVEEILGDLKHAGVAKVAREGADEWMRARPPKKAPPPPAGKPWPRDLAKPKFKLGDRVKVVDGSGRTVAEGEVTWVTWSETIKGQRRPVANFYQIGGKSLFQEEGVEKVRAAPKKRKARKPGPPKVRRKKLKEL